MPLVSRHPQRLQHCNERLMIQANPVQPAALSAARNGLSQLWRWWASELKAMRPPSVARWLDGDTIATNVAVDDYGLTILNTGGDATKSSSPRRVQLDALANNVVLHDLIAAGRDRVRLVLMPYQALVKLITLPLATEENLREVAGFELDRHTPFTPDQAYFDVQIVRRDAQNEKLFVALAVASKSDLAALVDTLRRAGLTCTAIGIHEGAASNAAAFDLQPAFEKPPRRLGRMHQINLGLLALATVLVFAVVILPIWQKREAVKALIPQAEKSGAEFQISERVYAEYAKLAAEYNFLATRKHAAYPVLTVVEELARTFPDTTWVQKLDIKANGKVREVTVLGEAQSASKVIENLEQSPLSLFQNSKQLTQTTRMQPNTERFHVSAEIKPRPVPAAQSIDEVIAPVIIAPVPTTVPSTPSVAPAIPTATVTTVRPVPPPTPALAAPVTMPDQAGGKNGSATPVLPAPPLTTFNGPPALEPPAAKVPAVPNPVAAKRSGS